MTDILALDIAACTGWAMRVDGKVESGVFDMSGCDLGEAGYRFGNWLADTLTLGIRRLIIEEPFSFRRTDNSKRCDGLVMIAHSIAHAHQVARSEVSAPAWRKRILGKGNLKTSEAKKMALSWARLQGFNPKSHDEAEALAILTWALETGEGSSCQKDDRGRKRTTPPCENSSRAG